jgi:hypothetical protein
LLDKENRPAIDDGARRERGTPSPLLLEVKPGDAFLNLPRRAYGILWVEKDSHHAIPHKLIHASSTVAHALMQKIVILTGEALQHLLLLAPGKVDEGSRKTGDVGE